jgi:hypothetical protein
MYTGPANCRALFSFLSRIHHNDSNPDFGRCVGAATFATVAPRKKHGTHGAQAFDLKILTFRLCASMQIAALIFAISLI